MTAILPCFAARLTGKARAPATSEKQSLLRHGSVAGEQRREGKARPRSRRFDSTRLTQGTDFAGGSHGKERVAQISTSPQHLLRGPLRTTVSETYQQSIDVSA
jgi:hypothetical protein